MTDKKFYRNLYSEIRNNISDEDKMLINECIFHKLIESDFYRNYSSFLIYVSFRNEIETHRIIQFLLDNGKKVAVPYCSENNMDFYYINSTDELSGGKFGIPSVDIPSAVKVENFDDTLCIVPGLSFDNNGNRLGYGGGFYDRFLSDNSIPTLGLCYEKCICNKLPAEEFDVPADCVLTEKCFRNYKK